MNYSFKYRLITLYYRCIERVSQFVNRCDYVIKKKIYSLRIKKVKVNEKSLKDSKIILFSVMRNESMRLSHFIEYYEKLGVKEFILLDNNSSDETITIAEKYNNINLFSVKDTYKIHWYWIEHLLEKYGKNKWCLVVDIDELFIYPNADKILIYDLCKYFDKINVSACRSLLLDMYSDKSVKDIGYVVGQNPLHYLNYFDNNYYEVVFPYFDRDKWKTFESTHFTGGMRERVFGKSIPVTSLNKFPLIKFKKNIYLGQGMHAVNGAKVGKIQGVVFHTKFLNDFILEAEEESIRQEHFNNAAYYKDFKRKFDENPNLSLSNERSIKYEDIAQLVELGLMNTEYGYEEYVKNITL